MPDNNPNDFLKSITQIILEEMKRLISQGASPNINKLQEKLKQRDDVTALLNLQLDQSNTKKGAPLSIEKEVEKLKEHLSVSQNQRDQLMGQIDEVEAKHQNMLSVYQTAILLFVNLLRKPEYQILHPDLDLLKTSLKEDGDAGKIDQIVARIKNTVLKSDLDSGAKEAVKTKSLPGFLKWIKSDAAKQDDMQNDDTEALLDKVKIACRDLVNHLSLVLDDSYLSQVVKIARNIDESCTIDDINSVKNDLLFLLDGYVNKVSDERERAAFILREIGTRLAEVEGQVYGTFDDAKALYKSNDAFSSGLGTHISELKQNVDFGKTLEEIKKTMITRLEKIESVIEEKRKSDLDKSIQAEKKMVTLKKVLSHMMGEVNQAKKRADALEKEILIDPLTGVYNRRAYDKFILAEFQRFHRHDHIFSVLLFDVDHFKRFNDNYGHDVGDRCLTEIIKRAKIVVRDSDFLARFGGEEFIAILPETDVKGALEVAEKMRRTVENIEFLHENEKINITISIGVTQVVPADKEAGELFSRMDKAMYEAKKGGRNRVVRL